MRAVTGNTFPVRKQLKAMGGHWNPRTKLWSVPNERFQEAQDLVNDASGSGRSDPCDDFYPVSHDPGDDDYPIDGVGFAEPGGRSALRAATRRNPRNLPCPHCGQSNRLTPIDRARGYQCNECADRAERGFD